MIAGWYHVAGSSGVAPAWRQMSSTTASRIEGGRPVGTTMYPFASRALPPGSGTAGTASLSFNYLLPPSIRAAVEPPPPACPRIGPDRHHPARQPATRAPPPVPPPAHGLLTLRAP